MRLRNNVRTWLQNSNWKQLHKSLSFTNEFRTLQSYWCNNPPIVRNPNLVREINSETIMVCHVSMEVAKTVIEVADVAWTAVEHCQHHHHNHDGPKPSPPDSNELDIESVRAENERLRLLLEKNLSLLQEISSSPTLLDNCPSDLHDRLLYTVKSESFLNEFESLREKSTCTFPFDEPSGADLEKAEVLINIDNEQPSWWVWVSDDMVPKNTEEKSEIDNENYVVVTEEHVVDGVATFMARCILANPKSMNLTPSELQKALMKALEGMNKLEKMVNIWHAGKLFYTLAMWGLTIASLYQGRAILRLATLGVHHSSKAALKIL